MVAGELTSIAAYDGLSTTEDAWIASCNKQGLGSHKSSMNHSEATVRKAGETTTHYHAVFEAASSLQALQSMRVLWMTDVAAVLRVHQ